MHRSRIGVLIDAPPDAHDATRAFGGGVTGTTPDVGVGATVEEEREKHTILRDPAGLVFCLVPVRTDGFAEHAVEWS